MSPSPLVGYNTNVRHHGKVFHIQTEDSGVSHGHIHTHLFADGGRIVVSRKTSYREHLGTQRFPAIVKSLMKAQHKAMFVALRDGLFDEDEMAGAREFALREIVVEDDRGTPAETKSAPVDIEALDRAAASFEPMVTPPVVDAAASFEAAAASYEGGGFGDALPSLGDTPSAGITTPGLESPANMISSPGSTPSGVSATFPRPDPNARASSPGKYSVTAPVTSRNPPKETPQKRPKDSLFGHDLLSEKSLDEVILSYLADDLDEKK